MPGEGGGHAEQDRQSEALQQGTRRPVIGVVAQEISVLMTSGLQDLGISAESYIAASYVKAVEASGARVVPIFLNQPDEYYKNIIKSINGLVLPGGNTWFYEKDKKTPREDGYLKAVENLYNAAKEENKELSKKNMSFPVLGICLGFEALLFIDNGKEEVRGEFRTFQGPLSVDVRTNKTQLKNIPYQLIKKPISYFSHRFYVDEETMKKAKLKDEWDVIGTTSNEERGTTFVSIIESKKYPFIGVQFHPEKIAYEWKENLQIPHDRDAVTVSRTYFDWLVDEAKRNDNSFHNSQQQFNSLINNYKATFTPTKLSFDEVYFFPQEKKTSVNIL